MISCAEWNKAKGVNVDGTMLGDAVRGKQEAPEPDAAGEAQTGNDGFEGVTVGSSYSFR